MREFALIPLMLAALGAAGSAAAQESQPAPATRVSGPRLGQGSLADLNLTPNTTLDQVIAAWGEPVSAGPGPAEAIKIYYLASRERLWLSFGSDGRLTRAILLRNPGAVPGGVPSNAMVPVTRVLVNTLEITRRRSLAQLDFTRALGAAEVDAAWGPPDSVAGSGIEHWLYTMADGSVHTLAFYGDQVFGTDGPVDALSAGIPPRGGGPSILGDPRSRDPATGRFRIDPGALRLSAGRDGQEATFLGTTPESTFGAPNGSYIGALFADDEDDVQDYLWFTQHSQGFWSVSGGIGRRTNQDAAGNIILNPLAANRDYGPVGRGRLNYTRFIGFFWVPAEARLGPSDGRP